MKLDGKNVLITGASSGIGHSLARELASRGNKVAITARREDRLQELAREINAAGGTCLPLPADGIDAAQSHEVVQAAIREFGHLDVAVLNAGGGAPSAMATAGAADVLHVMRTNYDTLVNFLTPMIEHMKAEGGVVAYTGSPAGYIGLPGSGAYSAAKAAGRVLIDACRIEQKDMNIRFVAMYPGFTYTEGFNPDDVPIKALIITLKRTVKEMIYAIEREKSHYMFPKRIRFLMMFARMLPEPIRRRLFAATSG